MTPLGAPPDARLRLWVRGIHTALPVHAPPYRGHHEGRDGVDAADGRERVGEKRRGEEHREPAVVKAVGPGEDLVEVVHVALANVALELLFHRANLKRRGGVREREGEREGGKRGELGAWEWRSFGGGISTFFAQKV